MMEQELSVLHNRLANQIVSMIPVQWSEFHYLGEVEKGKQSSSSVFYFRDAASGDFIKSNHMPALYQIPKSTYMGQWLQLNKILLEIYDCFPAHGQPVWEQLSLSVNSAGKFHIDYKYDVIHAQDGGQLVRELLWARETFGFVPQKDTPAGKVLERYFSGRNGTAVQPSNSGEENMEPQETSSSAVKSV